MRSPKREQALAWIDYSEGKTVDRPLTPEALKKQLANDYAVWPKGEAFPYNFKGDRGPKPLDTTKAGGGQGTGNGGALWAANHPDDYYHLTPEQKSMVDANLDPARGGTKGTRLLQSPIAHVEGGTVTLNAGGPKNPRGDINLNLGDGGRPVAFDIRILEGDRSTFLHEISHFLSWSMHDLANSELATPAIIRDYEALVKWAGWKSPEERVAETAESSKLEKLATRTPAEEARLKDLKAKEERISHGWEQYVLEGKAPSPELAGTFSRFKGWLLRIYNGIQGVQALYRKNYGQEINLSDDVRGIFDRMLATEQAISDARSQAGAGVKFPGLFDASSPAERMAYDEAAAKAKQSAEQEVGSETARVFREQVDNARPRITEEVTADIDRQRVYRAQRFLTLGDLPAAEMQEPGADEKLTLMHGPAERPTDKLNRPEFVKTYGKEVARLMPRDIFHPDKTKGVSADDVAPLLGYQSGDELVKEFRDMPTRDRVIANAVQDQLDREFGPVLKQISDEALKAVHNDFEAEMKVLELRAMAKHINPAAEQRARSVDLDTLRRTAHDLTQRKPLTQLDPSQYARAERTLALKAERLWGVGKKSEAMESRELGLFNQMLYRATRDARDTLEKARKRLENTSEGIRADLGKADPAYRDVHDSIVGAVGLGEAPPADAKNLDQLLARVDSDAQTVDFDVEAIRALIAKPKGWDELTVEEASNVADAITNIRHLAHQTLNVEIAGKKQTRANYLTSLKTRVGDVRPPQPPTPYGKDPGFGDKARGLRRAGSALLQDIETFAHMLDGGPKGPAHDLLIDDRRAARDAAVVLTRDVLAKIKTAWEDVPADVAKLRNQRENLGDLLPPPNDLFTPVYTRDRLWMLFLNWGNEGNRQRVIDGNGWSAENVQKALERLTEPEAKFLQGVLDTIQTLYPALAAAHEKRTGLRLGKVDASPITVGGKEYGGGYFPLKADQRIPGSRVAELQEGDTIKQIFAPNYVRPTARTSATKARADRAVYPVDLTWGIVPAHLSQVIHDITYGDWVRQTGSIFLDPSFKQTTTEFLGEERAREFMPWLRDVANQRVDSAAGHQSAFQRIVEPAARSRIALAAMGLNFPSLARHAFDGWTAMADSEAVAPHHILAAYAKMWNPGNWNAPEIQASKAIAYHRAAHSENLRAELGRIGPKGSNLTDAVTKVAFAAHDFIHSFTSRVAFRAAYDQAIGEGATPEQAAKRGDDVVERSFPNADIAEKPAILRSKTGLASAVMFYGYAAKIHNLRSRSFDDAWRMWNDDEAGATDKASAIAAVAGKWIALGAVASVGSYLAGRAWKKDEDKGEWLGEEVLLSPLDDVAIAGPAAKALLTGHKVNIAAAPAMGLLEDSFNHLGEMVKAAQAGEKSTNEDKAWKATEAFVSLLGPVNFAQRTVPYAQAVSSGKERPRNAADVASGLIYGKRKNQSANPISDLADLIGKR